MSQTIADVTSAMQTAIAPVFLIMGASALLGSMAMRYGRVLDRARKVLSDREDLPQQSPRRELIDRELAILYHRARLLRLTIILDAASVFGIVLTILVLFGMVVTATSLPLLPLITFGASLILLAIALALLIQDFAISRKALKAEISASLPVRK